MTWRMSKDNILVDFEAPTRRYRNGVMSGFDAGCGRSQCRSPRHVIIFKRFKYKEVRDVRREVHAGDGLQRTIAIVRGYADVPCFRYRRDFLGFQKTT